MLSVKVREYICRAIAKFRFSKFSSILREKYRLRYHSFHCREQTEFHNEEDLKKIVFKVSKEVTETKNSS